ncbi:protoporphyrinogen oxidase [Sporosarcina sp. YIM B06819]|uniref:protoporphyrinogen oxidase n=1 Tax=Sporosarcina sp. YIM B06819 TaxID=3081769 RepID=UPI00298C04AD|nr:protoporphyrinogen oxidase [Sporosarcina sp. YIM B06819]
MRKIIIVGGGITGLSAAFYAKKWFDERQIPVELTLIEKSDTLGGKIRTLHREGFIIERGPESFLARKMPIMTLVKELGLEDELTATNPQARTNYIVHKGKLHNMPPGLMLGIPTKLTPFMKTKLISPAGKIRAAMDLWLPKKKGMEDESLGNFIQRRLGKEVLDHITEPLLGGIYAGDTHSLSLQATFPHFSAMEKTHRSLIVGMLANKQQPAPGVAGVPEIVQKSMFLTFRKGMITLVERLQEQLQSVQLLTGQGVQEIRRDGQDYEVCLDNGQQLQADGLIMALPTHQTAKLLANRSSLHWLEKINYVSVANIALAFDAKDFTYPLNGSGFVIPRKEGRMLTACTWSSSKWLHTTPNGKILLRCYVGRGGAEEWVHLSDEQLIAAVLKDLKEMMGIQAKPLFHEITRLQQSMPQYPVGHVEELKKMRADLAVRTPGVYLCGAGYEGVGIPDCIQQGKEAAQQLVEYLGGNPFK